MRRSVILSSAAVFSVATAAHAQSTSAAGPSNGAVPTSARDAAAYCEYVKGVADSTAALEMAPTVFGTAGIVSGQDVSPGGSLQGPAKRVIAGGSYSIAGLYRGIAIRSGADAECRRYRAISLLHAFLEKNREGLTPGSLAAKLTVLDEAMPRAEAILRAARLQLLQSRIDVQQLEALELRVDSLRTLAAQARADLGAVVSAPAPPDEPIERVLEVRGEAEREAERYEARVRMSHGWDFAVRGGYDQTFGTGFSYIPIFVLGTVTLNLGAFFQPGPENRAETGRVAWARAQIEGADDRVEQLVARLRALRDTERKRLDETRVLLADMEARYGALQAIRGAKVAEYAQYLWFDLIRTRADHAYLEAHVADLERLLGR
jgi:hypothetical protein